MVINLSEQHSLITNWIAELRDEEVQKDRMRFRRNLERIGEVAAYEISKTLPFEEKEIQTPLGIAQSKLLASQPVIAPDSVNPNPNFGRNQFSFTQEGIDNRRSIRVKLRLTF